MTEYLDVDELALLTGSKRHLLQVKWLLEQEIPHKQDRKRVIVSRVHVRAWLEGRPVLTSNSPNWGALKHA